MLLSAAHWIVGWLLAGMLVVRMFWAVDPD